jgi:hypothetical protein
MRRRVPGSRRHESSAFLRRWSGGGRHWALQA